MTGKPFLFIGEQIGLSTEQLDRVKMRQIVVEEEEIQQLIKKMNARIPVREFGWERRNLENETIRATTLSKEISHSLRLVGQPQTFDLYTKEGKKASVSFSEKHDYNNSQSLFLIREDLLKQYLKKTELNLIWAIWGERDYSSEIATSWQRQGNHPTVPYKVYQTTKRYDIKTGRVSG